jgi:hypothetical protein
MVDPDDKIKRKIKTFDFQTQTSENTHLGSSDAFTETENPLSDDPDNISDEKLDEILGDD